MSRGLRTLDEFHALLSDPHRRRAADPEAAADRTLDRQHVANLRRQMGRDGGQHLVRGLVQLDLTILARTHEAARDLMRLAEGHPLLDEPFRDVGGQREAGRGQFGHPRRIEAQRGDHARESRQDELEGGDRVEDGLLVFLKVAVVRDRQPLEGREQAGQIADQAPRLAAGQLGDVGVLLLGHDARPGRVSVVERHESELAGVPEDDLLRQPRQIDADHRRDESEFRHDVTGRRAVEGVLRRARQAEFVGDELRVEPERRSGERAAPVRRDGGADGPVAQALEIAHERPGVRLEVMRQQDRLRVLKVCSPGHDGIRVRLGLRSERIDDTEDVARDRA